MWREATTYTRLLGTHYEGEVLVLVELDIFSLPLEQYLSMLATASPGCGSGSAPHSSMANTQPSMRLSLIKGQENANRGVLNKKYNRMH